MCVCVSFGACVYRNLGATELYIIVCMYKYNVCMYVLNVYVWGFFFNVSLLNLISVKMKYYITCVCCIIYCVRPVIYLL